MRRIVFLLPLLTGAVFLRGSPERAVMTRTAAAPTRWRSADRTLLYDDRPWHLKGVNWHGMEGDCNCVHGLWVHPLDKYMSMLQGEGFNAIRLPLSFEGMRDVTAPVKKECTTAEPAAHGLDVRGFLRLFLDRAQHHGMFVVLDLHTIGGAITPSPWTGDVDEDEVIDVWRRFAAEFGTHPTIMGIEIKNEPHGIITTEQFQSHCKRVILAIENEVAFQGMYFIDGVSYSTNDNVVPWGGSIQGTTEGGGLLRNVTTLEGLNPHLLEDVPVMDRIVFSPHIYGPDVRDVARYEGWEAHERRFGFLTHLPGPWNKSLIIPTEFGGHMRPGSPDLFYFESWMEYMNAKGINAGGFFWTFPSTSVDTGGLITGDNWDTWDQTKLDFLRRLQPSPTHVDIVGV